MMAPAYLPESESESTTHDLSQRFIGFPCGKIPLDASRSKIFAQKRYSSKEVRAKRLKSKVPRVLLAC